jgi:hypothetical protein
MECICLFQFEFILQARNLCRNVELAPGIGYKTLHGNASSDLQSFVPHEGICRSSQAEIYPANNDASVS